MSEPFKEKFKVLYELAKYALHEETQRSSRIDEKASRYLSVLSLLLGIIIPISIAYIKLFIPITMKMDVIGILLFVLFVISLTCSWYATFSVFKVTELQRVPMNDNMINYFEVNDLTTIYKSVAEKNFKDCLEFNTKVSNDKTDRLENSYKLIIITIVLALLSVVIAGYKIYYSSISERNEEVVIMLNNEFIDSQEYKIKLILESPKRPNSNQSDPRPQEMPVQPTPQPTAPPPNETITEGVDGNDLPQNKK